MAHYTTAGLRAFAQDLSPGLFHPRNTADGMDEARAQNIERLAKVLVARGDTVEGYEQDAS